MEPVIVFNLIQSLTVLTNVVKIFRERCIDGITANKEHCLEMVEKSVGIITVLNPYIGYEKSSLLAQEVLAGNQSVTEIVEQKVIEQGGNKNYLFPKAMTEPGVMSKD